MKDIPLFSSKTQKTIAKQVLLGFAGAIILGSIVLMLPGMTQEGSISYIDALFTSTSAICVTGLIVQDTAIFYTDLGKAVILFLIQIGGLGIMTIGSIFGIMLGRKISIKDKFYINTSYEPKQNFSAGRFLGVVAATTFIFEITGFIIISAVLFFKYSYPLKTSMTFSLFHSISAFNNAGFSLYSNNLESFIGDIPINLVIMALIVSGGLGFPVISEIFSYRKGKHLSLHAKMVLMMTGFLIFTGAILFFLIEFRNPQTIGNSPVGIKVIASFFQSVTARTAGFNTAKISGLNSATIFILTILMFIGASPGGTGGGIKTTTFLAVTAGGLSTLRGRSQVTLLKRTLPNSTIYRALTLTLTAIALVISVTIGLLISEKCTFQAALFEAVSAFGTVGLSTGITQSLTVAGKTLLILSMFIGRIGISTLSLAIVMRGVINKITYPEEKISIG